MPRTEGVRIEVPLVLELIEQPSGRQLARVPVEARRRRVAEQDYVSLRATHFVGVVPRGVSHVWVLFCAGKPVLRRRVRVYRIAGGKGGLARELPQHVDWALHTTCSDMYARLARWGAPGSG